MVDVGGCTSVGTVVMMVWGASGVGSGGGCRTGDAYGFEN